MRIVMTMNTQKSNYYCASDTVDFPVGQCATPQILLPTWVFITDDEVDESNNDHNIVAGFHNRFYKMCDKDIK